MADNIAVTPGSGATIAADDVSNVLYQIIKVALGADGSATLLDGNSGNKSAGTLRVVLATDQPTLTNAQPVIEASRAAAAANIHLPSSNTAAVVTFAAAGSGVSNVIGGVAWSYSATPTAGNLKIEDGSGTTVFSIDITSAGPGFIPFARPLRGATNTALIITLAAGGSGVSGKANALSKWTE